jgi:hypothetical protein
MRLRVQRALRVLRVKRVKRVQRVRNHLCEVGHQKSKLGLHRGGGEKGSDLERVPDLS